MLDNQAIAKKCTLDNLSSSCISYMLHKVFANDGSIDETIYQQQLNVIPLNNTIACYVDVF